MKAFNKQLLTTGVLLLALCGLTSFNPLSHDYNGGEKGAASFASVTPSQSNNQTGTQAKTVLASAVMAAHPISCATENKIHPMDQKAMQNCLQAQAKNLNQLKSTTYAHSIAGCYEVEKSYINKEQSCADNGLKRFNLEQKGKTVGTVYIDRIEKVDNSNNLSATSGIKITFRINPDKQGWTEAALCKDCYDHAADVQTMEISGIDFDKLKEALFDDANGINKTLIDSMINKFANQWQPGDKGIADSNSRKKKREDIGCHEKNFGDNILCFRDKFDDLDPDSDADVKQLEQLKNAFRNFIENAAKDDRVSATRFRQAIMSVAQETDDRDFVKEVRGMADEGSEYKNITANSEQEQKQLATVADRADVINRQMNALRCSQNNPTTPNLASTPGARMVPTPNMPGMVGMNNMMSMTPQGFACSQLQMEQSQIGFQLEDQVSNIKSEYRSDYFIGKKDDFSAALRQQLADDYDEIITNYKPFIKDRSLLSLDSISTAGSGNWVRVNPNNISPSNFPSLNSTNRTYFSASSLYPH